MLSSESQHFPHIAPLRIAGPDRIRPAGQRDSPISAQINNDLTLALEAVNMPRFMVLRVAHEGDTSEAAGWHTWSLNLSRLGCNSVGVTAVHGSHFFVLTFRDGIESGQ